MWRRKQTQGEGCMTVETEKAVILRQSKMVKAFRPPRKLGQSHEQTLPLSPQNQVCQHPSFRLLGLHTCEQTKVWSFEPPVWGNLLGQPEETNQAPLPVGISSGALIPFKAGRAPSASPKDASGISGD